MIGDMDWLDRMKYRSPKVNATEGDKKGVVAKPIETAIMSKPRLQRRVRMMWASSQGSIRRLQERVPRLQGLVGVQDAPDTMFLASRIDELGISFPALFDHTLTATAGGGADARDGSTVLAIRFFRVPILACACGLQNTLRRHTPTTALRVLGDINTLEPTDTRVVKAFLVSSHAADGSFPPV